MIEIKLLGLLGVLADRPSLSTQCQSFDGILEIIIEANPKIHKRDLQRALLFLNGKAVKSIKDISIGNGDTLTFINPSGGG